MQIKEFSGQSGKLFYGDHGSGEPVVLLHGFGESGSIWEGIIKTFSGRYRLIIPDIPGSGLSPALTEKSQGLEIYACLIREMLSAEVGERYSLLGHSMGGYISLALAEKYPADLKGWGLIHSTAYADSAEKKEIRKKAIEFIRLNGSSAFLETATPGLFFDREKSKEHINKLLNESESMDPDVLIGYYKAMMERPDRTLVLTNSRVPVCIIAGQHDQAVPISQSLEQSHLPAICHLSILRNSAHMGMLEETEAFERHFGSFLASL